jgi:hypothetical protein
MTCRLLDEADPTRASPGRVTLDIQGAP